MREVIARYEKDPEVAAVTIQTTFEGFSTNSASALAGIAKRYNLSIPIGHNGWQGRPSPLMYDYRTRGTPWVIIIDKAGMIRYSNFYLKPEKSFVLIDQLKKEPLKN